MILAAITLGAVLLFWMLSAAGHGGDGGPAGDDNGPVSETPIETFLGLTSGSKEPAPAAPGQQQPASPQRVFETLGFPALMPDPSQVVKLPILMFHHVGETPAGADQIRTDLTVSAADFEAMMAYLKEAGYQPVTATQLFKALFTATPLPAQAVMLTFDDGYLDNYTVAVPILEKYGFKATINVISDKMGSVEYMSWEQVSELDRKGIDIGSHTASHADLTILSAADLRHELFDSASAISSHLGHPVYWLCYPSGAYDTDVIKFAREAGYLLAFTTETGEKQSSDAPYQLLRYRVRNVTGLEKFKELVR